MSAVFGGGAFGPVEPGVLAFLFVAGFVAGLARGFSGFGAALIFVPLASAAIGPRTAVPLLLVMDLVMAAGLIPGAWVRADRREVAVMALGAALGVPMGTWVLTQVDPVALRWGLCALCALLLVLLASGWRYRGRLAVPLTLSVGGAAGLLSGAAQVGGPPVVAYWLGGAGPAQSVRANLMLYFAASSLLTTASYLAGGLLTVRVLALAAVAGPAYGVGIWLGARMFGLASEAVFRRVCYALIAAAAVLGLPVLDGLLR
ncbi:MAG TPA: sulfite exporter TauE/SafE family protein [Azospirillaceae bacterium]|nr:sulfite exporter TauE/SafE family protein [Azospirillaceae bacterium]